MPREKKIVMKYLVEITVEGYGDEPYFKEVANERLKQLHLDVTSSHVNKGAATVEIKRSKILKSETPKKEFVDDLKEIVTFCDQEQIECSPAKHLNDVSYYSGICCEAQYVKEKIEEIRNRKKHD